MSKQTYRVCFCFTRRFKLTVAEAPAEIRDLFDRYSENGIMTVDHVHRFLIEVEGEDKATKEDAESIMESLNELKHLNIFHRKGLHLEAFFHYLFSDSNPPLSPSPKIQEVIRGTKDALSLAQVLGICGGRLWTSGKIANTSMAKDCWRWWTRRPRIDWFNMIVKSLIHYELEEKTKDCWSMVAAFGSGAMFSLVSGLGGPNQVANVVTSGLFFALVQGGLFKDVYMYFRGSGKAAEMKREAAKRTMMAALP